MLSKKGEQMKKNKILTILCSILFLSAIGCSEVRRFYYESGELKEEASYNKGKQEGLTKTYYVSGPLRWEANYKGHKQEGFSREYYRSGGLKSEVNYKDGQKEGITKTYYVSGELRGEANYKEGKQEGLTKEYYRNGEIFYIDTYKDDQLIKKKTYDETGKPVLEQDFPYKEKKQHPEKLDSK